ncbi:plasmid mobilization relaxosome protein MobC, partial [Thiolapillus sp.]|uniref:plasmid mobilization relaxosome protein MobC n=1 Tax=Thiolapillus sp. TaxID=2017437 RepID=UPI003AF7CD0E
IALRESNRELAAIGRNLNQIARAVNIELENIRSIDARIFPELKNIINDHTETVASYVDASANRWGVK